jgi:hypothetical protein
VGAVDARESMEVCWAWWTAHASPNGRGRPLGRREFYSIWQWAVAQPLPPGGPETGSQVVLPGSGDQEPLAWSSWATWLPVTTGGEMVQADFLRMDDGRALLHLERRNLIFGDSGVGKSWVLVAAVAECVRAGVKVLVLDLEDTPRVLAGRLEVLGLTEADWEPYLFMAHPSDPAAGRSTREIDQLVARVRDEGIRHVFIDSWGVALGLDGLDENSDPEVTRWLVAVADRLIHEAGAGVTLVDHITKAGGEVAMHPSGTKRKRADVTGSTWSVHLQAPGASAFKPLEGGRIVLRSAKDRHGEYPAGIDYGALVMDPTDLATGQTAIRIEALSGASAPIVGLKRPDLLAVVVATIEKLAPVGADPVSQRLVLGDMRAARVVFSDEHAIQALEVAAARGFVTRRRGLRGAWMHGFVKPIP